MNAGWSLFPVAVLPGQSTFEMSITSGKFDAELFSMANATEYKENATYAMPTAERHTIDDDHKVVLLENPVADSVSIKGMEEVDASPEVGQFVVGTKTVDTKTVGELTFNANETATDIEVIYDYEKAAYEAIIDNKSSAIGEASCIWPVYGSGDDCSESAIVGYYIVKVFRARITTVPGMDTSYKSAATFQFTLSALDAKRNDEGAYSTAYFKK